MTKFRELQQRKYVNGDQEKIHILPNENVIVLEDIFKNIEAYSYYDGNKIIGIVGVMKINNNTCELCALIDECAKQYVREIYHYALKLLDDIQQYFERIQVVVGSDWPVEVHFIERLGFEKEGLMKKFGPDGSNYNLYGRVR